MSTVKTKLNEIAEYPYDAYVSSRRMARMMSEVLNECSNRQQISLYANSENLFMQNNVQLQDNEYLYLMRQARRAHGYSGADNRKTKRKRWTFCWQGSAIYFNRNASGNEISANQPMEYVLPEVECRTTRNGEEVVTSGSILEVIRAMSIDKRATSGAVFINNGMRNQLLQQGKPITAHFAIAVAKATGKHADKASHPDYCRQCDREVMMMARFKVRFSLSGSNVYTLVAID